MTARGAVALCLSSTPRPLWTRCRDRRRGVDQGRRSPSRPSSPAGRVRARGPEHLRRAGVWIEQDQTVTVNGRALPVEVPSRCTLADALRERGLTGTRVGCEHGVCGTCTVLLDGSPVRSCLILAVQTESAAIESIEQDTPELEALRRAFNENGALQCGVLHSRLPHAGGLPAA